MALVSTGISNCLRTHDVKATRDHQSVFVDTSHLSLNVIHWSTLLSAQELKFDFMRFQQGIACTVQWYVPLCWVTCGDWSRDAIWPSCGFQTAKPRLLFLWHFRLLFNDTCSNASNPCCKSCFALSRIVLQTRADAGEAKTRPLVCVC